MPLVITINPNSGELQSNISLLSLCNTWYPRHFPSCCCSPVGRVFFLFTCTTCRRVSEREEGCLYCLHVYVCQCTCMHACLVDCVCQCLHMACVIFVQFDISSGHTNSHQNDLISPQRFSSVKVCSPIDCE